MFFTILYDSKTNFIKQIRQKTFERILFVANIFLHDAKLNELINNNTVPVVNNGRMQGRSQDFIFGGEAGAI